jgi:hypothetical protein
MLEIRFNVDATIRLDANATLRVAKIEPGSELRHAVARGRRAAVAARRRRPK